MMSMMMGHRLEQRQVQRQEQRLTQEQRQVILCRIVQLRLQLVSSFAGDHSSYRPEGVCPKCGRKLTSVEILKGFRPDPYDFTTACTGCGARFRPKLIWSTTISRVEIPFYCELQTQEKLRGLEHLNPEELKAHNLGIYHSAIAHFGLLKNAFRAIGIEYQFDEVSAIESKVAPFLGKLPDTMIAELSGLSVRKIGRLRRTAKIEACSRRSLAEDAESD